MYTLKVTQNFYDKEHPGTLLHTGELLHTEDSQRAEHLVELGLAEIVSVPDSNGSEVTSQATPAVDNAEEVSQGPESDNAEAFNVADYDLANVKQALNAIGVKVAANAGAVKVAEKVSELSEDQLAELKKHLS